MPEAPSEKEPCGPCGEGRELSENEKIQLAQHASMSWIPGVVNAILQAILELLRDPRLIAHLLGRREAHDRAERDKRNRKHP